MNKYAVALYDDEDVLKSGIKQLQSAGVKIHDVYTPYPVHGLENLVGVRRSRLDIAAFWFGCLGVSCAFVMKLYIIAFDRSLDCVGKSTVPWMIILYSCLEMTVILTWNSGGL